MDLYILDSLLRRTKVIDLFESLIWTERFAAYGDFEFHIYSTSQSRALLTEGTRLAINESKRVMVVETIEDKDDSEGRSMLKVSGRSLEAILEDRVARNTLATLDASPRWALNGTPGAIARQVFQNICIDGMLDKRDIIPFLTPGSIFPADNILESQDILHVELDPDTVYGVIKELCTTYSLGFALVRDLDTSHLHFTVYAGSDRTSAQKVLPPIIFSPDMDSLTNVTELISIESFKNVAYVLSPKGTAVVYADGSDPSVTGFDRRALLVKVDNVEATGEDLGLSVVEILQKRGRDALATHRRVQAFDGEIPTFGHRYGIDYNLGDLVEMRKNNGVANYMRVTEQIFVSDSEGDRSYPTLSLDLLITPGSWFAWDVTAEWEDAVGTWDEAAPNV